jgi:hypothetical protein
MQTGRGPQRPSSPPLRQTLDGARETSMTSSFENRSSGLLGWAVALLGASASVFLAAQVHLNILDKERLQAGIEEARRSANSLALSVKQAEEAFQKREIYLQKVHADEARLSAFLDGLLELSKTDPDARGLVSRHKVGGAAPVSDPSANPAPQRGSEQPPSKPKPTGR